VVIQIRWLLGENYLIIKRNTNKVQYKDIKGNLGIQPKIKNE